MSLGMMMLPPNAISLPFKLIFFVLVDGWRLVSGSLVQRLPAGLTRTAAGQRRHSDGIRQAGQHMQQKHADATSGPHGR